VRCEAKRERGIWERNERRKENTECRRKTGERRIEKRQVKRKKTQVVKVV